MRGPVLSATCLLVVLAGCGEEPLHEVASGSALAALDVIDTRTELRPLDAELFDEAESGTPLDAGDVVRTDDAGFAEILYGDGSLTRLGPDTTVTVVALDGDVTVPEIELDLEVGRVWNRVRTVTGERGRYEVQTDVGVAAVRGTAFFIECSVEPVVCTFVVTEGVVVVLTNDGREIRVEAGEAVTLGADGDADGGGGGSGDGGDSDSGTDGSGDGGGGSGDGGSDAGGQGAAAGLGSGRTTEIDRATFDRGDPTSAIGGDRGAWVLANAGRDDAARYTEPRQQCSVTVAGRNVEYATTPATAIEAPIDETLRVDAVATGELERYAVDLELGGLSVRAAQGEVLPDESGDRTSFRGEIDVSRYAQWGVGLYEVTASTTGTECLATAYVDVTGRSPLATGGGLLALLAIIGGLAGLVSAIRLAMGTGTATTTAMTLQPPSDPA